MRVLIHASATRPSVPFCFIFAVAATLNVYSTTFALSLGFIASMKHMRCVGVRLGGGVGDIVSRITCDSDSTYVQCLSRRSVQHCDEKYTMLSCSYSVVELQYE